MICNLNKIFEKQYKNITLKELAKVYTEAVIKSPEIANLFFVKGLRGDVTPAFLLKDSKIKDLFTPSGKLNNQTQAEIEKMNPKGLTVREFFESLLESSKVKHLN